MKTVTIFKIYYGCMFVYVYIALVLYLLLETKRSISEFESDAFRNNFKSDLFRSGDLGTERDFVQRAEIK